MVFAFGVVIVIWIILYFMGCSIGTNMINPATFIDALISFIILLVIYIVVYCFFYYVIFRKVEKTAVV
ncbi:MAG: hypothetical protein ACFE8A_02400 [Candidatus Hodarchaeota archaeon]